MKYKPVLVGVCLVFLIAGSITFFVSKKEEVKPAAGYHQSMYYGSNPGFFTESIAPFQDTQPLTPAPRIFIVNQHVLAASLIAHQFMLAADPKVEHVILVTQNNWNAGTAPRITSRYGWKTPLGDMEPDTPFINALEEKNLVVVDETIFAREHGITGVMPYVAAAYPNARVTTIVIRDKTQDALLDELAKEIETVDLSNTVVVASIDMSHYLPEYLADVHDRRTIEAIQSFDYAGLPALDIDTAPTLHVALKVAEQKGLQQFVETGHVNSATIVGNPNLNLTTSYITGYFAKGEAVRAKTLHLLFVGDVMLDRGVALHAEKHGVSSLLASLERMFLGNDAVIGNLEGTITENASISIQDNTKLKFTFAPSYARWLADSGFTAVSQANNHALDFGTQGYMETRERLTNAGVLSFGSPLNNLNLTTRLPIRDKVVCLVGYHSLYNPDTIAIVSEIQNIRQTCSRVIVMSHWGIEYQGTQSPAQETAAHSFIDAGADIVVGAHPHVVQPIEVYKGHPIFYSLGNFIFDQDFSFATTHGLAVHMELGEKEDRFTLVPISIKEAEASIAEGRPADIVRKALVDSRLSADLATSILETSSFTLSH
ncbi:MAG: AmmeMemoRadiSam system protein [Parcubacteria group bacterium]|nr:AmmeMemoRadiSam system protein [Parcubacteria group bacterium]